MKTKLTVFLIAMAMAWVGYVSSSFACNGAQQGINARQNMVMAHMGMQDCPMQKTSKISSTGNKCAVACYGLAVSGVIEPLSPFTQSLPIGELPAGMATQLSVDHILGVLTPPPNFA